MLWNGLFLRDEAIAAWPYAAPRNHRGQVAPGDAKLDMRCVTVLYLESTRLFAPETHKRHLRPHDAAYKRLADEPPAGDDFTRDLRNAHRDRLRRWTEEFDEEERYPMEAGSYDFVQYGAGQNVTYRRVGKSLLYRRDRYQVGDIVRFALTEEKRREDQSLGAGRIVAFICDAEQTNTSGFFICSSVLAPRDDAAGQAFVMGFSQRGADLAALEAAGPARWSRALYVACPSNRLRGAKLGADGVKANRRLDEYQLLAARALQKAEPRVCFVCVHPGNSLTDLTRNFPAPVRPTIPIFSPGRIVTDISRSTSGSSGRYESFTRSKTIEPCRGHSAGGAPRLAPT